MGCEDWARDTRGGGVSGTVLQKKLRIRYRKFNIVFNDKNEDGKIKLDLLGVA